MSERSRASRPQPKLVRMSALQRVLIVTAIAGVVAAVLAWFVAWQLSVLASWNVAAIWFLASVWVTVAGFTPAQTHALATREDDSRVAAELLLVLASLASLAGIGFAIAKANQVHGTANNVLTVAAVVTVISSWAVVHTVFALRYAHQFYRDPVGGINFSGDEDPDYQDFAYVAFTIGMTYQVSDTDVGARRIRRTMLRHALLSYLFGAVILAVTINVIAGFFD